MVASSTKEYNMSQFVFSELWNRRVAHIYALDLATVHEHAYKVPKLDTMAEMCRACHIEKAHKLHFHGHLRETQQFEDVMYSDIVGPLV